MSSASIDFCPEKAQDYLEANPCYHAITAPLACGNVILLRDLRTSLTPDQARALARYGASKYYKILGGLPTNGGWALQINAGLIYDKASIPQIFAWFMQRDRIPEAATAHDGLYAALRLAQLEGRFSRKLARRFRRLADEIFWRHLKTQQPSVGWIRRRIIYRVVRLFGHRPRK